MYFLLLIDTFKADRSAIFRLFESFSICRYSYAQIPRCKTENRLFFHVHQGHKSRDERKVFKNNKQHSKRRTRKT